MPTTFKRLPMRVPINFTPTPNPCTTFMNTKAKLFISSVLSQVPVFITPKRSPKNPIASAITPPITFPVSTMVSMIAHP